MHEVCHELKRKLPMPNTIGSMTNEQFIQELQKGMDDISAGRVIPADVIEAEMMFAEQILADLIAEGLSGEELLNEFQTRQSKLRLSVEAMPEEVAQVARGIRNFQAVEVIFYGTEWRDDGVL